MILYHGSIKEIPNPSITLDRDKLDFGKGFYATELFEQAKIWAYKRASILNSEPVISTYEITNTNGLNVHRFDGANELLRRIKIQKRNQQVCIVNQKAIERLKFIKGECV